MLTAQRRRLERHSQFLDQPAGAVVGHLGAVGEHRAAVLVDDFEIEALGGLGLRRRPGQPPTTPTATPADPLYGSPAVSATSAGFVPALRCSCSICPGAAPSSRYRRGGGRTSRPCSPRRHCKPCVTITMMYPLTITKPLSAEHAASPFQSALRDSASRASMMIDGAGVDGHQAANVHCRRHVYRADRPDALEAVALFSAISAPLHCMRFAGQNPRPVCVAAVVLRRALF